MPDPDWAGHYEEDKFALACARIEVPDDHLLRNLSRIRHILGVIVQGRCR